MEIKVKYHSDYKLEKTANGDWIDLYTAEEVVLSQFEFAIISLGVSMKLPEGCEANIVPRSSTYKHWGIIQTNSFGVIDNSYSGDDDVWGFPCVKLSEGEVVIPAGTRLCQFRINKQMENISFREANTLDSVSRKGFGSSGK